ncbi:MlaD family protein [Pseudoduganella sp. GCM10020061]|uniref:MlaD family protein n=1 Tax=Pseudoduganella sp. GCM10020061 TaxID=3317345 RepID=UPI00363C205E
MQQAQNEVAPEPVANVEAKAIILLVLVAALIGLFLLYIAYARGVFQPTQRLVLLADDSEGVVVGMDMTFSGFPIGRVQQVDLGKDGKARILVDVPVEDAKWLRTSSIFTLERGMVGDTKIKAFSGILTDPPLPDNAEREVLRGDTAAEIPRLVASARTLLDNLVSMTNEGSSINESLSNIQSATGRLGGKYGLLGGALGSDAEARKLVETVERLNTLLAKTDQRVYGKAGLMDDVQASVRQLNVVLQDASNTLKKADAVLVEAQAVGANARAATQDLGALRGEVDASLRKINQLVDDINRKWPFAREKEIKLP